MLKVSFGKVDAGRDMIAAAAGSGRDFINAAMAKGRAANRQDKAAVMARYQRVIRQAVPGELREDLLPDAGAPRAPGVTLTASASSLYAPGSR